MDEIDMSGKVPPALQSAHFTIGFPLKILEGDSPCQPKVLQRRRPYAVAPLRLTRIQPRRSGRHRFLAHTAVIAYRPGCDTWKTESAVCTTLPTR